MVSPAVAPRISWVPSYHRSLGADCIAWWEDAGGMLFEWQKDVINGMLILDESGKFITDDGLCVARQNGKGVIEQAIEGYFAFELGYPVVMHTSHEFATSIEHQIRLETVIQNCPHLHAKVKDKGGYVHANGQESIRLKSGCRIIFKARTKGGGRGYSGDLLVWDEAMVIPEVVVGAQMPMLRASRAPHGPKIIFAGSAVDQEVHYYGVPFARMRERGLRNDPKVSYFEWSAPFDHPAEMTDEVLRDRSWWHLANPSMPEGLIDEEHMAEEIEGMADRTAAVELACVGDWPATDGSANAVINPKDWSRLVDEASELIDPIHLVYDVSPDRMRASIVAVGKREDGLYHGELIERREGTGWLLTRLPELYMKHRPDKILCDGVGPAASLVKELEPHGVFVETINAQEYAQACGFFVDTVAREELRHLGQPELASAIRGAVQRPLGDAWAWSRKNSATDISPLVGLTIGVRSIATYGGGGLYY